MVKLENHGLLSDISPGAVIKEYGPGPGPVQARIILAGGHPILQIKLTEKSRNGDWHVVASRFKVGDKVLWEKLEEALIGLSLSRAQVAAWKSRLANMQAYGQEVYNTRVSGTCPVCKGLGSDEQCEFCWGEGEIHYVRLQRYEEARRP